MADLPSSDGGGALVETLMLLAQANFSARAPRAFDGSREDTLAYLVNTVSEELQRVVETSRTHEAALESAVANFAEVLSAHAAGNFDVRAPRTEDGSPLDVLAFIINNTGEETGRLFEERNRAYEELETAQANEAISRARSAFLANVSHELRTPLTLILGPLSQLLSDEGATRPEVREELRLMYRNATRLARMVNDLLDFTRAEEHKLVVRWQRFDAAALIDRMIEDMKPVADSRRLTLTGDVLGAPSALVADRRMFEKITMNLLSNALKFTMPGGTVSAELTETEEGIRFVVRDTGIGISAGEAEQIFDRFHQVDSTQTRRFEGSGLGLALVREFSRAMGGDASVASTPGRGSTFSVFIPRYSGPPDEVLPSDFESTAPIRAHDFEDEHAAAEAPPERSTVLRPYVLLAEDNADMRRHVRSVLAKGFEVTAVADGEEALEALEGRLPDVIISDVMMPRVDGFELVARVKKDPRLAGIPVVLLTARAGSDAAVEGLDVGADDYLAKPFSPAELVARVRAAARLRALNLRVALTLDELQRTKTLRMRTEQVKIAIGTLRAVAPTCDALPELESLVASPATNVSCDICAELAEVVGLAAEGELSLPVPGPSTVVRRALQLLVQRMGTSQAERAWVEELSDGRRVLQATFARAAPCPSLREPLADPVTLAELELGAATLALMKRGLEVECIGDEASLVLRFEWG